MRKIKRMKMNAYLENSRRAICDSIKRVPPEQAELRRDLIWALTELDAFRHGALQNCDKCGYEETMPEGP